MSLWNNHKKHAISSEDDEEDMPLTFEEQVIDEFAKLAKRLTKLENAQDERIARLEAELQRRGEYIEMLLARLLDKDYVVASISKTTSKLGSSYSPASKSNNSEKLATPVGKLP